MHNIPYGRLLFILVTGVTVASACTQTYSQAPLATPTLISTGLFVSPFPSGQDPLQIVADLGTQTAVAKTAEAGGAATPGTSVAVTGTPVTASGVSATATLGSATASGASTVVPATKSATPQTTAVISTSAVSAPSSYTLQAGEFPYCIARRFDINPDQLLSANGITDGSIFYPGKTLTIPQSAGPFPGDRSLRDHPDTYTVASSDTTIYGVACYYGDVLPQDIASRNALSLSSTLTAGQLLTIP
ncbi:MAG: LysM peptidoglycan-binding domain-containing protein [Chloroflexota bacterium]